MKFEVRLTGRGGRLTRLVELERAGSAWRVWLDGQAVGADVSEVAPNTLSILLAGQSHEVRLVPGADGTLEIYDRSQQFTAEVTDSRAWRGRRHGGAEAQGRQQVAAPMPGKIIRVLVKAGDKVECGQGLLVVEAMKMQNEIRSPKSGTVERVFACAGQTVNAGEVLLSVD
jgi:biotin carboxyl carrier protein